MKGTNWERDVKHAMYTLGMAQKKRHQNLRSPSSLILSHCLFTSMHGHCAQLSAFWSRYEQVFILLEQMLIHRQFTHLTMSGLT